MIKSLKGICFIFGLIFFLALLATPFIFEAGTIKDFATAIKIGLVFFALFLCCRLGHWILCDHEKNMDPDFREYLEDLAKENR